MPYKNPEEHKDHIRTYRRWYNSYYIHTKPHIKRRIQSKYHRKLRRVVEDMLGGCCAKCGKLRGLHIHHIFGDGEEHRKRAGGTRGAYREIRDGIYPLNRVTLLCRTHHDEAEAELRKNRTVINIYTPATINIYDTNGVNEQSR